VEECKNGNFETLINQTPRLTMAFPDGSPRSDGSVHLKRQMTYTLTFSEHITGQFDLIVIRKHYPYEPLLGCPFSIPTMPQVHFKPIGMSRDTVMHYGVTFGVNHCNALSINFDDISSSLSPRERQMKFSFKMAKKIQLLLFCHCPTTLLGKIDLQVVSDIRPERFYKNNRRLLQSLPLPPNPTEDQVKNKKKDLVSQIRSLYKADGTNMNIDDLNSFLTLSKSLVKKSSPSCVM
jgi:hypothetical protein